MKTCNTSWLFLFLILHVNNKEFVEEVQTYLLHENGSYVSLVGWGVYIWSLQVSLRLLLIYISCQILPSGSGEQKGVDVYADIFIIKYFACSKRYWIQPG